MLDAIRLVQSLCRIGHLLEAIEVIRGMLPSMTRPRHWCKSGADLDRTFQMGAFIVNRRIVFLTGLLAYQLEFRIRTIARMRPMRPLTASFTRISLSATNPRERVTHAILAPRHWIGLLDRERGGSG